MLWPALMYPYTCMFKFLLVILEFLSGVNFASAIVQTIILTLWWVTCTKYRKSVCLLLSSTSYMPSIVAGVLYFVSATVNPILYNVMSVRYRRAFRDTLHAAIAAARCQHQDSPASAAMFERHHRPLLRSQHSDDIVRCHQTFNNRRARSAECIRGWPTPNAQMRCTASKYQMTTLAVGEMRLDETSQTLQLSE